ncbi:MAG: hypothetical protein U0835_26960 [Isosphaeraceae bacterium]
MPGVTGQTIGGTNPGEGETDVSYNLFGVAVRSAGNSILGNTFHDNGNLGITVEPEYVARPRLPRPMPG